MARGEKPNELGNSWFSAKFIEVKRLIVSIRGRALLRKQIKFFKETPNVYQILSSRQTCDAKVSSQKGNSPDDMLRSQSNERIKNFLI